MITQIIKDAYGYFLASWLKFFNLPYLLIIALAHSFKLLGYFENIRILVYVLAPFVVVPFFALVAAHLLKFNVIGQIASNNILPEISEDDKAFVFHAFCLYLFYQMMSALSGIFALLIQASLILSFKVVQADAKDYAMIIAMITAIIFSSRFTVSRSLALVHSICYGDRYNDQLVAASKKTLWGKSLKLAIIACAIYFTIFMLPISILGFFMVKHNVAPDLIIKSYWFVAFDFFFTSLIKYMQIVIIASLLASVYKYFKKDFDKVNLLRSVSE